MKRYLLILLSFACISLAAQDRKSTKSINDEVLFAPEFHAYSHGRINNEQGEGRKWYNRFKVMHISDIHSSYSQLREALEVSEGKVSAVLNTGDDAHGSDMEDAAEVKAILDRTGATVGKHNDLPFLQVPGNHDVTGLTKEDYLNQDP